MKERTYAASHETKLGICAVLKGLMAQKPLNKITVAEVMKACGMARQHFYYHFEDINDAVRWMFENEAVAFLRRQEGAVLWQDGLRQLFQYIQDNRAVCLCALNSLGRDHLKRFFQTDLHAITRHTVQSIAGGLDGREVELLSRFYVGALVGLMEDCLLGEVDIPPGELIGFVDRVLQAHVRGALAGPNAADGQAHGTQP